jgi:RND family efflux transporter MFP subunit
LLASLPLLAFSACDRGAAPESVDAGDARADSVIEVETVRIRRGSIVQRISAPGSIVARREALIGPEVRGPIKEVFVEEGDRVEAGDPLFQIDPEPYTLGLRQAEAVLDRVRAERAQSQADLGRGRALERKKVVAKQETDRIETGVEVALAQEREAAEAVALARRNLERTLVRAPFAGSVTRRLADEGTTALVQPQTIVVLLQETQILEAVATIAEIHFAAIALGDVALLHVDGLARPVQTEVEAVGDSVDVASRTFRVKMPVPNEGHQLKAGLFVRVDILPRAKSEVILAPRAAVRTQDGRDHVLVVRDGVATSSPIEVGLISESAIEVIAGLRVDDEVVIGEAARTLGPGMRVRVRSQTGSPGS